MSAPTRPEATAQAEVSAGEPAADLLDTPRAGATAIRGGAVRMAGYAIAVPVNVLASALLLRHLGVLATGDYVTVVSLVTLAGGITDAGLATIGVRELSTLPTTVARHFFASLCGLRLVFIFAGMAAAVGFATLSGYRSTLVLGTAVAGGGFVLLTTQTSYSLPLLAQLRLGWVTAVELLRQLGAALTVMALVFLGASLLPFWAATIPAGIVASVLAALLVRDAMPLMPRFDRAVWASLLRRTLPYSMATAVGVIYFRLAILIMSHVASGVQTGYFGASFRIIEVLFVVPQLLVGSILPIFARAARDDRARLDYSLGRTFDVCLLLGLATGLFLLTGASFVIAVIAGPKFDPAAAVLRIQGVALVATFAGAVLGYGLLSLGRYREMLLLNLAVLLASGVLTSVLASSDGAVGAATATTTVELLYTVALAITLARVGARPKISVGGMSRAVLAALLGALIMFPAGISDALRPMLALGIYGVGLVALGAIPAELREQIPWRRSR